MLPLLLAQVHFGVDRIHFILVALNGGKGVEEVNEVVVY